MCVVSHQHLKCFIFTIFLSISVFLLVNIFHSVLTVKYIHFVLVYFGTSIAKIYAVSASHWLAQVI